jgi:hypothetical protein
VALTLPKVVLMITPEHSAVLLFLISNCPGILRTRAGKNRKKRLRLKRKGQAAMNGASAEWVADCPWSGASRLRVEPGGLGRELASERDSEGTSPVYGKGLAAFCL